MHNTFRIRIFIVIVILILFGVTCNVHSQECGLGVMKKNIISERKNNMKKDFRVNYTISIDNDTDIGAFKITTHQSGILWLDYNHTLYLDLFRSALTEKKPLEIEYIIDTKKVEFVNYPIIDMIPGVEAIDKAGEYIRVAAMKRPSVLRLYRSHPRFKELYDRLLQAEHSFEVSGMKGIKAIIAHNVYEIKDVILAEKE